MSSAPVPEIEPSEPKEILRRRWRFQYSLRTLLIVVSIGGVLSGWIGSILLRAHDQRAVVKKIQALGGQVYYDYQQTEARWGIRLENTPPGPGWVRWMLGDDVFAYAEFVFFNSSQNTVKDKDLALLRALPRLKGVVLDSSRITDEGLEIVSNLPNLQEVNLSNTSITGKGLGQLEKAQKLENLTLSGVSVSDSTLEQIDKLKNLKSLQLVRTSVTDDGMAPIARLTQLKWLDLFQNGGLTYKALKSIGQITSLESLHIVGNSAIDRDLDQLKSLHKLKILSIISCSFNDGDLGILNEFKDLIMLNLNGSPITDIGLVRLRSLTKLEQLDLGSTKISNQGLVNLAPLANLQYLNLFWTKIDKDDLAELKGLSNLKTLKVGPGITRSDLLELHETLPKCYFEFIDQGNSIEHLGPKAPK
jgi:Leucine-rich repeat (LRR) protein